MLENPAPPSAQPPAAADPAAAGRRYAPPNQRNRTLNRRKSSDFGDVVNNSLLKENPHARLIALEGCCSSEASQLLNDRWEAVMQSLYDPSIDLSERPVMYSGLPLGQLRFPHQLVAPTDPAGSQIDFLAELRRAMLNANANFDA